MNIKNSTHSGTRLNNVAHGEQPATGHRSLKTDTSKSSFSETELPHAPGLPARRLSPSVRKKMESILGEDFTTVQIYEGSEAASMGAVAFAQGDAIYFAPGRYNPHTDQGQATLAHELTHVVQQRQGRVGPTRRLNGSWVNDDPALEWEADCFGRLAGYNGDFHPLILAALGWDWHKAIRPVMEHSTGGDSVIQCLAEKAAEKASAASVQAKPSSDAFAQFTQEGDNFQKQQAEKKKRLEAAFLERLAEEQKKFEETCIYASVQALQEAYEASKAEIEQAQKAALDQEEKEFQEETKQFEKNCEQRKKFIDQRYQDRLQQQNKYFDTKQKKLADDFKTQTDQIKTTVDKQKEVAKEIFSQKKENFLSSLNDTLRAEEELFKKELSSKIKSYERELKQELDQEKKDLKAKEQELKKKIQEEGSQRLAQYTQEYEKDLENKQKAYESFRRKSTSAIKR